MCLDVDVDDQVFLRTANPRARKPRPCCECLRQIEPGETYRLDVSIMDFGLQEYALCAHCDGTLDLGVSFTGCPKQWWYSLIHDLRPDDGGFVGDILTHDLTGAQRVAMLRTVAGRRKNWRRRDGSLLPVPGTAA